MMSLNKQNTESGDKVLRYRPSEELDAVALKTLLEHLGSIRVLPTRVQKRIYHDTFDWRLYNMGTTLESIDDGERARTLWTDLTSNRSLSLLPAHPPAFVWDLPHGALRERLEPVLEMRRILPLAVVTTRTDPLEILNRDGKVVVRLMAEEHVVGQKQDIAPIRCLRVAPVRGYNRHLRQLQEHLAGKLQLSTIEHSLLEEAVEASTGRKPGAYSSKLRISLAPDTPAIKAVKAILATLLDTMEANLQGTLDNLDSEFLHDFRVSVRRTRSALGQIKDVFPSAILERFRAEFAWLGQVTGPTRDMDVFLLTFPAYQTSLPKQEQDSLVPLRDFLVNHGDIEHRAMVRALRSRRYRDLVSAWRSFVSSDEPEEDPGLCAYHPIRDVASARIWKMFRRAIREGNAINDDSPAEMLHEMRKTCKKLRYLLEFFRSLYPKEIMAGHQALKVLQDNLGEFQDLHVQSVKLAAFARAMQEEGKVEAESFLAMGTLVGNLLMRQKAVRAEFRDRFSRFAHSQNQNLFASHFGKI